MNNLNEIFKSVLQSKGIEETPAKMEALNLIGAGDYTQMSAIRKKIARQLEMDEVDVQLEMTELAVNCVIEIQSQDTCHFGKDIKKAITKEKVEEKIETTKEQLESLKPEVKKAAEKVVGKVAESVNSSLTSLKEIDTGKVKEEIAKRAGGMLTNLSNRFKKKN